MAWPRSPVGPASAWGEDGSCSISGSGRRDLGNGCEGVLGTGGWVRVCYIPFFSSNFLASKQKCDGADLAGAPGG